MTKKQMTVTKINEELTIEVVTFNEKFYRVVAKRDGIAIDARHRVLKSDVQEQAQELISDVIAEYLGGRPSECGTVLVEGWKYNVWVAIEYYNGKVSYDLSAIHEDNEEREDKNIVTRKTWKGLVNYVSRYSN